MSKPSERKPEMVADGYKHLRTGTSRGVYVIQVLTPEIQGPDLAKEFIAELDQAVGAADERPVLLDLGRVRYLSSMGYSALFKVVKWAKERKRPIRICNMHEDVRVGAEAVNLPLVVEIHGNADAAFAAFECG
jgi:anti-anti-sigma factor